MCQEQKERSLTLLELMLRLDGDHGSHGVREHHHLLRLNVLRERA
jgi:hypothetical protein